MSISEAELTIKRAFDEISSENSGMLGEVGGIPSYAYARVSSSGQAEEGRSGLPRQLRNIHERAQTLHLCIPYDLVFFDDHTGFEFRDRPGLQTLLQEAASTNRRSSHVVIEYLDRLSRNAKWHQGYLLDLFADGRVAVHFWKSFGSEIERAVMGAISEQGMRHEIERMVEGTVHKAQSGRITAKTPAYGYVFADSKGRPATDLASEYRKDTHYILHPEESLIVREVYDRLLGGESLFRIADILNVRGVPTPKHAKFWRSAQLHRMVKRTVYKGEFFANRSRREAEWDVEAQKKILRYKNRTEDKWILINVPAIVTEEEWESTQVALKRNNKVATRNAKEQYLVQGYLRCACCGERYRVGSTRHYVRTGKRVYFYICGSRQKEPSIRKLFSCDSPYIRRDNLDVHVWDAVCKAISNPDIIMKYLEEQSQKVAGGGLSDQIGYVEKEIAKCDREESQWDRAFAAEIFGIEEYKGKKRVVATRREALLEEREKLYLEHMTAIEFEQKRSLIHKQLETIMESGFDKDMPFADKRRIVSLLVDSIVINTKERWFELHGHVQGTFRLLDPPIEENQNFTFPSAL